MTEELSQGAVSLEDDPAPVVDPPAPVADPPPPPNPEDADPEGVVVNQGGEKLVPLSALVAQRQAARDAKAEAAALRPKAEQAEKIAQEWQNVQPIIQRAMQQQQQAPPPPKPAGPLSADEALEYAKDLDLYTPEGKPDVDRAQRLAGRQQSIAEKQAQQYVAPLLQHTAQGQSRSNFEQAANFKDAHGHVIDRAILETVWNAVPAEMSAQPQIAAVLYRQALAETVLAGKYKGASPPPPPPPVHTEGVGGGTPAPQTLTNVDHLFRQASDMTEKQFTTIREKYQPGRTNSLE